MTSGEYKGQIIINLCPSIHPDFCKITEIMDDFLSTSYICTVPVVVSALWLLWTYCVSAHLRSLWTVCLFDE